MQVVLKRTHSTDADFLLLEQQLDSLLLELYGEVMQHYQPFTLLNAADKIVIAYEGNKPIGCGCLQSANDTTVEIKRMFVIPEKRKQGVATAILLQLEEWAKELNYKRLVLESGVGLNEALALYTKHHYTIIAPLRTYTGMETGICMGKDVV